MNRIKTEHFKSCFRKMMILEGGYVNNPSDPGGETKYGISKRAYPELDIANLTVEQAQDIYLRDYWPESLDYVPEWASWAIFQAGVNVGMFRAIRWAQRASGAYSDGIIGKETLGCLQRADKERFIVDFHASQGNYYAGLQRGEFILGWMKRLAHSVYWSNGMKGNSNE